MAKRRTNDRGPSAPVSAAVRRQPARRRRALRYMDTPRPRIGRVDPATLSRTLSGHVVEQGAVREPAEKRRDVILPERAPLLAKDNCKSRPANNKSKGGGSRRFVPYCSRRK